MLKPFGHFTVVALRGVALERLKDLPAPRVIAHIGVALRGVALKRLKDLGYRAARHTSDGCMKRSRAGKLKTPFVYGRGDPCGRPGPVFDQTTSLRDRPRLMRVPAFAVALAPSSTRRLRVSKRWKFTQLEIACGRPGPVFDQTTELTKILYYATCKPPSSTHFSAKINHTLHFLLFDFILAPPIVYSSARSCPYFFPTSLLLWQPQLLPATRTADRASAIPVPPLYPVSGSLYAPEQEQYPSEQL